jgi:hypothetical protein
VRILAHHADRQLIGEAVVEAQADSAGGEVVPLSVLITVHIDKVPEASHPNTPAVLRSGLKNWFHDGFGGFSVCVGSVLQIHRGAVDLHVRTEAVGPVVEIL